MEIDIREGVRTRLEANRRAGLVGGACCRQRCDGLAVPIFLLVDLPIAVNGQNQLLRQCVHHRDTDAVQTAGDLVGVVVELTAGVKDGHDDLGGRTTLLGVDIHRNAATVVRNGDRFVSVDRNADEGAVTRQRLVNRVIDDLENHVMQTGAVIGIPDVHSRPLSDRLEAF